MIFWLRVTCQCDNVFVRKPCLFMTPQSFNSYWSQCFFRDDVSTALKLFQDAKEQGSFIRDSTCLLLLNSMARSGQTEQFESGMWFVYMRIFYFSWCDGLVLVLLKSTVVGEWCSSNLSWVTWHWRWLLLKPRANERNMLAQHRQHCWAQHVAIVCTSCWAMLCDVGTCR